MLDPSPGGGGDSFAADSGPDSPHCATLKTIMAAHVTNSLEAGAIVSILLPTDASRIVHKNRGVAHCFKLEGLKGLFRKDLLPTRMLGRMLCDAVKHELKCDGFFTTDELPKYGLTAEDGHLISLHAGADRSRDVVVMTFYTRSVASQIRTLLLVRLSQMWMESAAASDREL